VRGGGERGDFFFLSFFGFIVWKKKECFGIEKNISKEIKRIIRLCNLCIAYKKTDKDYKNYLIYPDGQWLQLRDVYPGSRIQQKQQKRMRKKICFPTFL
jgi:hypothetical protein